MDRSEAESRIREVQRIMERTTLYTLLPGPPAIVGGVLALGACIVSVLALGSWDFDQAPLLGHWALVAFWSMWVAVGAAAIAIEILWTRSASRRQSISPMARPTRFAVYSLSPSVFVAMVFTVKLLFCGPLHFLAPVWMMCYGTGLYAAGLFSVRLPRILGLAFIATGAFGLLALPHYGILLTAASFGLYHVAFGIAVLRRSRRAVQA